MFLRLNNGPLRLGWHNSWLKKIACLILLDIASYCSGRGISVPILLGLAAAVGRSRQIWASDIIWPDRPPALFATPAIVRCAVGPRLTVAQAAKAGAGPEGHKRTWSVESGATTDTTLVADSEHGLDAGAKPTQMTSRAASVSDLAAKRGRVMLETPQGLQGPTTNNNVEGSSTAAAPNTVSSFTATALAVADHTVHDLPEPQEAPKKAPSKDRTHLVPACTCATEVHAFARGDEGYADVFAHALALAITAGPVVTASYSIPNAPTAPITTAKSALAAIRGGNQPRVPIDWAAVATDAKAGAVPPPSAAALRHLGTVQQPLSTMQAAYVVLANSVQLEPSKSEGPDDAAEQRLKDETDEIRAKVGRLMRRAGEAVSGTRLKSSRASKKEIAAAVHEAELADLEAYMFEHERHAHS